MSNTPIWARLRQIVDRLERREVAGENLALVFFERELGPEGSSVLMVDGTNLTEAQSSAEWARDARILLVKYLTEIEALPKKETA
jgi:hypothetical protein